MIPQPKHSTLSRAEWLAAFRRRICARQGCGKKITPSDRTRNPEVARRILTCCKACKSAYGRAQRTPAQILRDSEAGKLRFARWIRRPGNMEKHFAAASKKKRRKKS